MRRSAGEGSVSFIRGKWRVRLRRGGQERSWVFATRREAVQKLRDLQAELNPFAGDRRARATVAWWAAEWLQRIAIVKPATHSFYASKLAHVVPALGMLRLDALATSDITAALSACRQKGASDTMLHHIQRTLHTMCQCAVDEGLVATNPAHRAPLTRRAFFEATTLSVAEFRRLAEEADRDPHLGALVLLTMATGMRVGELLALRWSDIDWDRGTVSVTRKVRWMKGSGYVVGPPKTQAGRRSIPIGQPMLRRLEVQSSVVSEMRLRAGARWLDLDLVFPSSTGNYQSATGQVFRRWRPLLSRAQVPAIRFHDLRHTVGLLVTREFGIVVASRILGHSSPDITARYYGHARREDLERASTGLSRLMFDTPGDTPRASGTVPAP